MSIGLLICMFGLENFLQTQSTYFTQNGSIVNLAVGLVVVIATIFSLQRKGLTFASLTPVQFYTLALYAFGFVSYFWTIAPSSFEARWVASIPYVLVFLVLAPILLREKQALIGGMKCALLIGFPLLILDAFYCEWGQRGMLLAEPVYFNGVVWLETFPLAVASMASTIGIIALAVDLKMKREAAGLLRLVVLGLAIYVVFLTQSRGQVIALISTAAVVLLSTSKATDGRSLLTVSISIVFLSLLVYFIVVNVGTVRWEADVVSRAVHTRQSLAVEALENWWKEGSIALLVGVGANGNFATMDTYPHNLVIEILTELGFAGLLLYLYIVKTTMTLGLREFTFLKRMNKPMQNQLMFLGLAVVNFTLSLKEGSLDGWQVLFFFLICLYQNSVFSIERTSLPSKQLAGIGMAG